MVKDGTRLPAGNSKQIPGGQVLCPEVAAREVGSAGVDFRAVGMMLQQCLEMRFIAAKFKKLVLLESWKELNRVDSRRLPANRTFRFKLEYGDKLEAIRT